MCHHAFLNLNGVEFGLVEIELFNSQTLGDYAIGVAIDGCTLILHLLIHFFDFRFPNRLVANNPSNFFGDVVLSCDK